MNGQVQHHFIKWSAVDISYLEFQDMTTDGNDAVQKFIKKFAIFISCFSTITANYEYVIILLTRNQQNFTITQFMLFNKTRIYTLQSAPTARNGRRFFNILFYKCKGNAVGSRAGAYKSPLRFISDGILLCNIISFQLHTELP